MKSVTTESRRTGGRRRDDGGYTLVEVLVTIVLMTVVVVPVIEAVITSIRVSSTSRSAAQVETALINAADRVNRAPSGQCDYGRYARAAVQSQGWAADRATVTHAYFDPNPDADPLTADGVWVLQPCPSGVPSPPSNLVQRVIITVASPDGSVRRSTEVVKSDV
jgi:prepilin-type N-terminal cleavage/methylation domain-containing protein